MVGNDDSGNHDSHRIDPLSPYYLGAQDGPGTFITHLKLHGDNYEDWSLSMKMSLKSRRKFDFCDGTIKKPTDDFLLDQWEVVNCTIIQWIMNTIDPSLYDNISYFEEASLLWADLAERFAVVDGTKIHSLKTQITHCKQVAGMSVTSYYGKLKGMWDALAVHEPPFSCKCGKCTCGITQPAIKRQDNERLNQFFMGLDDKLYGSIRSQQLLLDPLPTLNRAYHVVLQEEWLRGAVPAAEEVPDIVAFSIQSNSRSSTKPDWRAIREKDKIEKRKLTCTHCNTKGHDIKSCFIKNQNFPDWWGDRPRTVAKLRTKDNGANHNNTSGMSRSTNTPLRANIVFCGAQPPISDDRLTGPCFEDDDWTR